MFLHSIVDNVNGFNLAHHPEVASRMVSSPEFLYCLLVRLDSEHIFQLGLIGVSKLIYFLVKTRPGPKTKLPKLVEIVLDMYPDLLFGDMS